MTILSNNLKRLREHQNFSKEFLARYCKTTSAAVAQWENTATAYVPKVDKLMALAGLYKTTIEEMYTNPLLVPGEIVSPILDNSILIKVFSTLDNSQIISYAFNRAGVKRRAYFFTLLYSLCKEITTDYLDETEVTAYMDIKRDDKKTKTANSVSKRNSGRVKSSPKKH